MPGYFNAVAQADTYFTDERLYATEWDDLTNAQKAAVLEQAYNRLYYSREFILPTLVEATTTELPVLRKANAEMAEYLAIHLRDEDRRKGIQAQAVVEAGVVQEKYDQTRLDATPIPQFVRDLLCAYAVGSKKHFVSVDIGRDEGKPAREVVTEFDV
jgi:hypothetical protein